MLPVQKPQPAEYTTLEEIQARREQLLEEINSDNTQFSKKWHQLFTSKTSTSKTELIGNIITKSITAIDTFLLVRKLMKNYGGIFGLKKKK